jgi:acyl dehydratase
MSTVTAEGLDGIQGLVGRTLGPTEWLEVTQERVNTFADATDDHQWIHVDVERANAESPFGSPIAHGYLTLSLVPYFMPQLLEVTGFKMGINYGTEKVRFPAPVPVGARLRASLVVDEVTEIRDGVQMLVTFTIASDRADKPACVAVLVLRNYG